MVPGCLTVGKVIPHLADTAHLTGYPSATAADQAVALDELSRIDDIAAGDDSDVKTATMRFACETFPARTRFATWVKLTHPTLIHASFFVDVIARFLTDQGPLGGWASIGHGLIIGTATPQHEPDGGAGWVQSLRDRRAENLDALTGDIR